jgi:dTDP-4-amino-4,6-dideoxygalactose transaminase
MKVDYVNLPAQWEEDRHELLPIIDEVLSGGQYVLGDLVSELELALAKLCEVDHCVALNSGTDALFLGLSALGVKPGDEVITPPNSFVASTAAIVHLGAIPVFVDVLNDQTIDPEQVRRAVSPKTKAIMPVHLTGRLCRMNRLEEISQEYGIPIIEDAAQSVGSKYLGRSSGSWGAVAGFSGHPLKNLAAAGDAGFLTTSDSAIAESARRMRNHGLIDRNTVVAFGAVSRLDTIQAAVLKYRLGKLASIVERRRRNAAIYLRELKDCSVELPEEQESQYNTYHTFVIQIERRDQLRRFLTAKGIGTAIHYPVPIHLQPAAAKFGYGEGSFPKAELQANRILSLPIHQGLKPEEVSYVAQCIKEFCRGDSSQ